MSAKYSDEFKQQAVQKLLNRGEGVTIEDIATPLGVAMSSINRWALKYRRSGPDNNESEVMTKEKQEKRPEDWTQAERLQAIIATGALSESQLSAFCRQQGIYAHHIEQWKSDFLGQDSASTPKQTQQKVRQLTQQNQKLKRDLTRKEKALAETAALLVLQKKVQDFWSDEEDT
jgi:transposase-like protein